MSLSDFPTVLFTPGNIVINSSLFVFDYMPIANQIPEVLAVLRYVIMTENRVCYFPCGPRQLLSSPGRPAIPTDLSEAR